MLKKIGLNARTIVEKNLNSYEMGSQIYKKIEAHITNTNLQKN
jgi:hypothetical protein